MARVDDAVAARRQPGQHGYPAPTAHARPKRCGCLPHCLRRPGAGGEAIHPETAPQAAQRGRRKQSVAANLLRRFRLHADAGLRFLSNPVVPFTNNVGERAMRMPKVKQKISGCFRTLAGAEHFCVIRSCLDTLRKQGHGMLTVLQRAFAGNLIQPVA